MKLFKLKTYVIVLCLIFTGSVFLFYLSVNTIENFKVDSRIELVSIPQSVEIKKYPKIVKKNEISTKFDKKTEKSTTRRFRSAAVIEAMQHSWKAYTEYAWGMDEVYPLTRGSSTWMGSALTMIDSLDTLYIMGLRKEFNKCIEWIQTYLHFELDKPHVNVFETTIRVLGGLLSAYNLSKENILLVKALDLGERLMPAFNTNTGIPLSDINLMKREASNPAWTTLASTAEAYTVILELYELSRLSKKPEYLNAAKRIIDSFHNAIGKKDGLVPIYIDPSSGEFSSTVISLGARGDSYYEYLLKYWLISGKKEDSMRQDYLQAVQSIQTLLVRESGLHKLTYVAELTPYISHKMDHLVCFLPGLLALGTMHGMPDSHLVLAKKLIETCYQMYNRTATGLSPEIVYFISDMNNMPTENTNDIIIKENDKFNLQRPETIESLFYLHRITGDPKYVQMGWNIFQAFQRYTRLPYAGYVSISDVLDSSNVGHRSKCESFWYSETLKYFYLLFLDSEQKQSPEQSSSAQLFDLQSYVFNTEGHPFPIV